MCPVTQGTQLQGLEHAFRRFGYKLVDYCFILASAKLIAEGTPGDLMLSKDPAVDQFMNGHVDGPISFRYKPGVNNTTANPS